MSLDMKRSWSAEVESAEGNVNIKESKENGNSRDNSGSRKKTRHNSDQRTGRPTRKPVELETDPSVLQRRQKQIDFGKNTTGYHNYLQQVPIDQRTKNHPKTPEKYTKYSRRSWDMLIKMWRKQLHEFDTDGGKNDREDEDDEDSIISGSSNE